MAGINHFAIGGEGLARGLRALLTKPSAPEALLPVARSLGARASIARYGELKRANREGYEFGESDLQELGWALVEMNRLPDAIEVYALNARLYPASSGAHYALGSAYRRHGDVKHAILPARGRVGSEERARDRMAREVGRHEAMSRAASTAKPLEPTPTDTFARVLEAGRQGTDQEATWRRETMSVWPARLQAVERRTRALCARRVSGPP